MTTLAEAPQGAEVSINLFDIPTCHFSETGLEIEPGMAFEHWERLLAALERAEQGIQWYLGDALNYGEGEYGQKYAQVLDAHEKTGIDVDTLRNYQWVADKVKLVTRVTGISWSAHREVATLPEAKQKKVLQGITKETPVQKVRRAVHKIKRESGDAQSEIDVIQTPQVQEWLTGLHKALLEYEPTVPITAPFLRNMIHAMDGVVLAQSERTVEADCRAILRLFTGEPGTPGAYRATDSDIFKWLVATFYFISDPELDERLDLMVEKKMLEVVDREDSRQEGRKGGMDVVYRLHPAYVQKSKD